MIPIDLEKLISLGYGCDISSEIHPILGSGIWRFEDDELILSLFDTGLSSSRTEGESIIIPFREIERIQSLLTVEGLSYSMQSSSDDKRLPLRVHRHGQDTFELSIPLPIYSSVLRGLVELTNLP